MAIIIGNYRHQLICTPKSGHEIVSIFCILCKIRKNKKKKYE